MNRILRRSKRFSLVRKKKKESDVIARQSSALEILPLEVKRHIATFLPIPDLLKLPQTSKRINSDLDVILVSSPLTDRASQNKLIRTRGARECFAIVFPYKGELHSHQTTFTLDVDHVSTDGCVWVLEQDLPPDQDPDVLRNFSFRRGKQVAKATITSIGKTELSFAPKTGKFYQFWVKNETEMLFNNMMLYHVGLGVKPSGHIAFQFEVFHARMRCGVTLCR